jgi:RNA polymerase I-specific transcription initiation factor RRN3
MPSIEEAPPLLIQPLAPALKRKLAEVEKSESKPTSPVKRQRVDFSSDVNVRLLRDPNERPLRLVRQEIERAIEQRREGDSSEYDALKSRLHLKPNTEDGFSDSELRTYVLAFTALPHAMGKECGGMVNALLNCGWLRRDERLLADFQRFLTTLMSAHSGYTPPILRWLVQRFTERKTPDF